MATRADLRGNVRAALTEAEVGGLASDADLNIFLGEAHGEISPRFPYMTSSELLVAEGATSVALGSGRLALLSDAAGVPLPEYQPNDPPPHLAWAVVADTVRFSRAVTSSEAGTFAADLWVEASWPADDVTALELPAGLHGALVALACARAVRARAADDGKRGRKVPAWLLDLARDFDRRAETIARAARRRARGGSLGSS